jgi:group I intron endonuclease
MRKKRIYSRKTSAPSGVYQLVCTVTSEFYVGSALNLKERRTEHFAELKHGRHHSQKIQSLYQEHGPEVFSFEVLEYVDDAKKLVEREQYYISQLSPSLNHHKKVRQTFLGKTHSEETKRKIGEASLKRWGGTRKKLFVCERCGKEFSRTASDITSTRSFCSQDCWGVFFSGGSPATEHECAACKKKILKAPSKVVSPRVFCNRQCYMEYRRTEMPSKARGTK